MIRLEAMLERFPCCEMMEWVVVTDGEAVMRLEEVEGATMRRCEDVNV